MEKESLGQLTWREISPLGRVPKKYINKLLNKDPETIRIVKKWIDKNGLIILFTQGKVKGWEKVWVSDDGIIYINDEDVRYLGGLNTELEDNDEVSILPALAGG